MKLFILIVTIALANAYPEAPKSDPTMALTDFINNAQAKLSEISTDIQNQLGINQADVVNILKNQTSALVSGVQTYIKSVSEDIKAKTPEVEKALEELRAKITKVAEDINASVPNAKESAELFQKQFSEGIQTVIRESGKIAETIKDNSGNLKEEVSQFTKKVIDTAVDAAQNVNQQLKQATAAST